MVCPISLVIEVKRFPITETRIGSIISVCAIAFLYLSANVGDEFVKSALDGVHHIIAVLVTQEKIAGWDKKRSIACSIIAGPSSFIPHSNLSP